jgi:phosphoserine phosphatase
VRREHLREAGRRIRIKRNIPLLVRLLRDGVDGHRFSFNVVSAAPQEVIESALDGIVPPENIHATRFHYDAGSGEVRAIERVPAGYGKVAVLDELQTRLEIAPDRVVYVGDGSSDVHVMLHVNRREGYSIAVSEASFITQIARRTVLSDDALSVLVPVLEDIAGWRRPAIRALFEAHGLQIHEWDRTRTDRVTIREPEPARG